MIARLVAWLRYRRLARLQVEQQADYEPVVEWGETLTADELMGDHQIGTAIR